jgi:hypothetical protein
LIDVANLRGFCVIAGTEQYAKNDLAGDCTKCTGWYFYFRRYLVFSGHCRAAMAHCLVAMACYLVVMPPCQAEISQITSRYASFQGCTDPLQPGIGTLQLRYGSIQAS